MAQVRLDPDVESALRAIAEREGVSLAHVVNGRLRAALGIRAGQTGEPSAASVTPPVRRPAVLGRKWSGWSG